MGGMDKSDQVDGSRYLTETFGWDRTTGDRRPHRARASAAGPAFDESGGGPATALEDPDFSLAAVSR